MKGIRTIKIKAPGKEPRLWVVADVAPGVSSGCRVFVDGFSVGADVGEAERGTAKLHARILAMLGIEVPHG